uniref:ent-copalyl diphosphate synthase 1-like n=1 Tax=Erigeron canadensis TaxID=72917 RepID=UPI001CB93C69|nr:ent-copalyl diphosphate synthase 1-like [Erigeron canadensis]
MPPPRFAHPTPVTTHPPPISTVHEQLKIGEALIGDERASGSKSGSRSIKFRVLNNKTIIENPNFEDVAAAEQSPPFLAASGTNSDQNKDEEGAIKGGDDSISETNAQSIDLGVVQTETLNKNPNLLHAAIQPPATTSEPPPGKLIDGKGAISNLDGGQIEQCNSPFVKHYAIAEDDSNRSHVTNSIICSETKDIQEYVEEIKSIFGSMGDGEISSSAYDTAWVALIENINASPQFPSSLEWIVNNQLPDGSWGETLLFSAFDRLLNTLACVIALTHWKVHPNKRDKGMKFVNANMNKLVEEDADHMTCGFEIVFPKLLELAEKLEIKVEVDTEVMKEIYARRDLKLAKIPIDVVHKSPTILHHSLEGMNKDKLEWEKILKFQRYNGSISFTPAATAFAFMQTKDQKCLTYLTNLVSKFNGGVPILYPVDNYEHIWTVDRLQHLGIARYFRSEIKDCVAYIYRNWNDQGIGYSRGIDVPDLDDTAMGFRLLRLHGYAVSPDVLQRFNVDGKFMCFPESTADSVSVTFNLFRASQVLFPGEKILNDAKIFCQNLLTRKQSTNELLDKWLLAKDLPGEIGYALDVPWYASLPRLEARYYLEQYGGEKELWIGKTIYRMGNVSNDTYLEMAKMDYSHCQAIHQSEWSHIQKWYAGLKIEDNLSTSLLWSYYEAAASIFEPERCIERLAWAKTTILLKAITSFLARPQVSDDDIQAFVDAFTNSQFHHEGDKQWQVLGNALHETLNQISSETMAAHGIDIRPHLHGGWTTWLLGWRKGVDEVQGKAELIISTIIMSSGRGLPKELLSHPQYKRLSSITDDLCHQISREGKHTMGSGIESKMQELVQLVLCHPHGDLDPDLKQTFLLVAKTFYYNAYFDPETKNRHISKVLFEDVI